MNKILLVLIAVLFSNSALAMKKDGILMPNRMKVTRNPFNKEAVALATAGGAGLLSALLQKDMTNAFFNLLTILVAEELARVPLIRIQMFRDDVLVEDTYTRGTFDCERLIAEKKATLDPSRSEYEAE